MDRSERLIKPGDSWFSPINIEVLPRTNCIGGKALDGLGVLPDYQTQSNSEYRKVIYGRQTWGANVLGQEGNNPDRQLRSQMHG